MYWKIFNFTLLAVGVRVAWKKWISVASLDARSVGIRKAMEDAARAKAEAEARLAEYKEKLALLGKQALRDKGQDNGRGRGRQGEDI